MKPITLRLLAATFAISLLWMMTACETQSGTDTIREVGLDISGVYENTSGGDLVSRSSGKAVSQLNLTQRGSELTGVDNNGVLFRGSVGRVGDNTAGFTLKGVSTEGQDVTINGTINVSGTTGTMTGRWIENTLLANVSGEAVIPGQTTTDDDTTDGDTTDGDTTDGDATDGDTTDGDTTDGDTTDGDTTTDSPLAISPSGNQTLVVGLTRLFSVAGGDGTFTWSLSNSAIGSLSSTTGGTSTYTSSAAGNQVITVSSGTRSLSITVAQTAPVPVVTALTVTPPSPQTMADGENLTFLATGGTGTYTWSVLSDAFGSVSSTTGASTVYTASSVGGQILTVTSGTATSNIAITQTAELVTPPTP